MYQSSGPSSRQVSLYLWARRVLTQAKALGQAMFDGFSLGIMSRRALNAVDDYYYHAAQQYRDESYNRSGLKDWEKLEVERFFGTCHRLMVVGAGGGREVLALLDLGFDVDGFECNPELAQCANSLLRKDDRPVVVGVVPRDDCPNTGGAYDGLIVGWGAYMLIQGSKRRTALLRQMRVQARPNAPLLVSFFCRPEGQRTFRIVAGIGTVLRRLLGRELVELGDGLAPNYVHYFTLDELRREFDAAGFRLVHYSTHPYGHAVGIADEGTGHPAGSGR
jgi:hypothetical protein